MTEEKLISNRGSIVDDGATAVVVERRRVLGEGGGGNPFEGVKSSITIFLNSGESYEEGER
jgi:hypothetical protein